MLFMFLYLSTHVFIRQSVEDILAKCHEVATKLESYSTGRADDGDLLAWDASKLCTLATQPESLNPFAPANLLCF